MSRADGVVRYGDLICLKHEATGKYLASSEECYESGSGQQRIFTSGWTGGEDTVWQVLPLIDMADQEGNEVGFDDKIRLRHVPTGRHLHSHEGFESPITAQQEVTGFGGAEESDENDVWELKIVPELETDDCDYLWHVDMPVIIKHVNTGAHLHSHEVILADDRNEVTGFGDEDENNYWSVCFED